MQRAPTVLTVFNGFIPKAVKTADHKLKIAHTSLKRGVNETERSNLTVRASEGKIRRYVLPPGVFSRLFPKAFPLHLCRRYRLVAAAAWVSGGARADL